jgi:hypothetical protein
MCQPLPPLDMRTTQPPPPDVDGTNTAVAPTQADRLLCPWHCLVQNCVTNNSASTPCHHLPATLIPSLLLPANQARPLGPAAAGGGKGATRTKLPQQPGPIPRHKHHLAWKQPHKEAGPALHCLATCAQQLSSPAGGLPADGANQDNGAQPAPAPAPARQECVDAWQGAIIKQHQGRWARVLRLQYICQLAPQPCCPWVARQQQGPADALVSHTGARPSVAPCCSSQHQRCPPAVPAHKLRFSSCCRFSKLGQATPWLTPHTLPCRSTQAPHSALCWCGPAGWPYAQLLHTSRSTAAASTQHCHGPYIHSQRERHTTHTHTARVVLFKAECKGTCADGSTLFHPIPRKDRQGQWVQPLLHTPPRQAGLWRRCC